MKTANAIARECAEEVNATFMILSGQRTSDETIDALTATVAPFFRKLQEPTMPETTDAEMLEWQDRSFGIAARSSEAWYHCEPVHGGWRAMCFSRNGSVKARRLLTGPLLSCIHACQEDADKARQEQGT